MSKLDSFAALSPQEIHALGSDAIPEIVRIVEERAEAHDVSFAHVARRLPDGWRQVVMCARALENIEETECLGGAFVDLHRKRDALELESFFTVLGADHIAKAMRDAREETAVLIDEDLDPLDIEELRDIDAGSLGLGKVRAALAKHVRAMNVGIPPG